MQGNTVGWIRSPFEQDLGERQMANRAECTPQRRPWEFAMPVPVVLGVGIRAPRQQPARSLDEPGFTFRDLVAQAGVTDIEKRLPILYSAGLRGGLGMLP